MIKKKIKEVKKININIVGKFGTILSDPPWEFLKTKQVSLEPQYFEKSNRYNTLSLEDIKSLKLKLEFKRN